MPTKPQDPRDAEIAHRVLRHWHEAVPNDRMAHLVKDAMRAYHRSLQARLARHGVNPGHWTFLRVLWLRDGLTKRELSIEAGVMEPTTFIALRAMAGLGYVTLQQRPDNRKNVYVWLTPAGRALEHLLVPLAENVNTTALAGLSEAEVATTRRALLRMIDNLARDPALDVDADASASADPDLAEATPAPAPTPATAPQPARAPRRRAISAPIAASAVASKPGRAAG